MSINITCDTSIGELVKESDVSSYLSQIKDTLSDYSTTVKKQNNVIKKIKYLFIIHLFNKDYEKY